MQPQIDDPRRPLHTPGIKHSLHHSQCSRHCAHLLHCNHHPMPSSCSILPCPSRSMSGTPTTTTTATIFTTSSLPCLLPLHLLHANLHTSILKSHPHFNYYIQFLAYFSLFCFLLPTTGATHPLRSGPGPAHGAAAMERRPAKLQHTLSFHISQRMLIIGTIQTNTSAWRRKDCVLDILIEIGDNTWKQQLNSQSFIFQVPVRSFGGMIGMVSVHERGGKWPRLWNHFFVVQDAGVIRLNATLSGDCTRIKIPGSALIPWIPAMCPALGVIEKTNSLLLFTRLSTDASLMCPVPFKLYVENSCIISGALEIYPITTHVRKSYFGMAFLKTLMTYINDQLQNPGESSDWHRVFGVYLLRTWHFHCLGIVFLFLQTVNYWFLRILESMNAIALSNFDCQVTGDLLDREPQTSCPSSDTSISSDILYQNSWGDAHQYLQKLMDSPVDGSGNYYSYTAQRRSFSDLLLQSGRWSRDSDGRLIRDLP
ncbi:hypothetical protein M758_3G116600 [Ceratodon purpureus]|nr:hypothetical protein M758_3G116600 [Ceratodon purpureus]